MLKSRCAKSLWQGENWEKPALLLPAAGYAGPSSQKKLELDLDEERGKSEDESECFLESESSSEDSETYEKMVDDELTDAVTTMRETQHFLNPQTKEKDLINKWFALVYVSKRERTL